MRKDLRACRIEDERGVFWFHCWSHVSEILPPSILAHGHNGGVVSDTFAIVEAEDGSIARVRPEKIRFISNSESEGKVE